LSAPPQPAPLSGLVPGIDASAARPAPACWRDLTYLLAGGETQRQAYAELAALRIMEHLAPFDPVLIGAVPIGLDIPGSDLDIACCADDLAAVAAVLTDRFGMRPRYRSRLRLAPDGLALVVDFAGEKFPIQVFAQVLPVERQRGYRHLLIEARLLRLAGEAARQTLRTLRQTGLKTEPAFARYFGLAGDPYLVLYEMSAWPAARLAAWYGDWIVQRAQSD
jgi:hypothetical protein